MTTISKPRIESIDLLRGLVMVIMALDHVRDYFHHSAHFFYPNDPTKTSLPTFFTSFITHFCAPTFCLLAGLSAFMIGKRKSPAEVSVFLLKRGLWLVFVEITIVTFAWYFNPEFTRIGLLVIWVLGVSMIVLAGLIHLPKMIILLFSITVIFGHNLLDSIVIKDNILWSLLHQPGLLWSDGTHSILVGYPVIPWIAVMSLGYCIGALYDNRFDALKRRRIFNGLGLGSILLFFLLVAIHAYGEPVKWTNYGFTLKTVMSILNISKYPPSLMYLLVTLGGAFLFLAHAEKLKGKVVNFFRVFGRVPFFYYIIHLYLIHLLAMMAAQLTGFGWQAMILSKHITKTKALTGYGFNLITVYLVWMLVIALLYPLCKKFDAYKQAHKEKWWLSYL